MHSIALVMAVVHSQVCKGGRLLGNCKQPKTSDSKRYANCERERFPAPLQQSTVRYRTLSVCGRTPTQRKIGYRKGVKSLNFDDFCH